MATRTDTWIEDQITNRGLDDTPEIRRQLRSEYWAMDPYERQGTTRPVAQEQQVAVGQTSEDQKLKEAEQMAMVEQTTGPFSGTSYLFPSRKINPTKENVQFAAADRSGKMHTARTRDGLVAWFDGDQLVNENGDIERGQYDVTGKDVLSEYSSITNPVLRAEFFSTLKNYDFYGEGKPSALALSGRGLTSTDENAIQRFLNYSSGQGRTWRAVMPLLQGQVKSNGGGGRAVSVVSTEDATRAFREESLRLLGRMPTQQEIRAAVGAIQARERSRGAGGSMDAPSLGTAAQEQARKAAPGEAAAQSAGQAINQIFALLGGR